MPEAGGLQDQPATWVEASIILDERLRAIDDEVEANRKRAAAMSKG